jgi:GT2 family glycosyltransferase
MIDLTILVCLYNKNIDSSDTIQSLLKADIIKSSATIYIWDNSTSALSHESIVYLTSNFSKFIYKHTPENIVLSKLYNKVTESLYNQDSYLMLCDDDSNIPQNFFEVLEEQIQLNPSINLFLPQIYSHSILVSPAKDYLIATRFIRGLKSGTLNSAYVTAINSGMVISNRVFINGFRYNEKLNFYGTDNYFMYQYSKSNKELIVLDAKFIHSLSFNTSNDIKNKLRIFREIRNANKIIYAKNCFKRQLVFFNNLSVAIKLCLKYKTLEFLY